MSDLSLVTGKTGGGDLADERLSHQGSPLVELFAGRGAELFPGDTRETRARCEWRTRHLGGREWDDLVKEKEKQTS